MRAAGRNEAQRMTRRDRQLTIAALEAGPTPEEPELLSLSANDDGDQEFCDRTTGLPLNPERGLETQYMEELKVLEDSDRDACMTETGRPPIPTDWVDINKGDSLRPNYRSRLVCQETRELSTICVEDWAATVAATHPYEAFKLQLSSMMTGLSSQVGYRKVMDTLVRLVRWRDDFSLSERRSLGNAFRDELGKHLLVKTTAMMGRNVEKGDVQEAIHLNRLLRLHPPGAEGGERWELEADPRHVEMLVSQMGLSSESKAVSTPGVRTTDEEGGKELGAEDRACYRSWTMRASYFSQDRCELQIAVKEFAQPNTKNMQGLKRLVRLLKGSPRCLVVYNRQAEQPIVDVFSDSDWAGCAKTRRSTSTSYVMLGGHLLAASATTQKVVATSSGEAEFYALTKSASTALGAVAMAANMSKVVKPHVRVHATASKAIASRLGVGRMRQLQTQVLRVQEAVARRELTIVKVPGVEYSTDMGTEHLAQREMHKCLKRAGCHITGGRSRMASGVAQGARVSGLAAMETD